MGEMNEYIEKTAALDICQKEYEERLRMADYCGDTVAWNIGGAIKNLPAADVVEVRHGRWEKHPQSNEDDPVYTCSLCKLNGLHLQQLYLGEFLCLGGQCAGGHRHGIGVFGMRGDNQ